MPESPSAVAQRWFHEVWNQHRSETIDELLTPNSVCHADEGPILGIEAFRDGVYQPMLQAFPDVSLTIDATVTEGDQVVVRWTARATHAGAAMGMEATGRPVKLRGITWLRIVNGKLMEGWQQTNMPEVFRSLAVPTA